jgi:hypothetical protein
MHRPNQPLAPSLWAKDDAVQDMLYRMLFTHRALSMCIKRVEATACINLFSPQSPPQKKERLFIPAIESQGLSSRNFCNFHLKPRATPSHVEGSIEEAKALVQGLCRVGQHEVGFHH